LISSDQECGREPAVAKDVKEGRGTLRRKTAPAFLPVDRIHPCTSACSSTGRDRQRRLQAFPGQHSYPNEQRIPSQRERAVHPCHTRNHRDSNPKAHSGGRPGGHLFLAGTREGAGTHDAEYASLFCEMMAPREMAPECFQIARLRTRQYGVLSRPTARRNIKNGGFNLVLAGEIRVVLWR